MLAAIKAPRPGPEVAPTLLLGRVALICRELEKTCNDVQEALSTSLLSDAPLPAALVSRLQEIDRISQTLGALAAFTGALETAPSGTAIDIGPALDQVPLRAVREVLCGLDIPFTDGDCLLYAELF